MKHLKLLSILLILISLGSCELIFDEDLENKTITLISPGENDTNDFDTQFFLWEEDEDVETYRFQLVSPNFTTPSRIFVDTLLTEVSFETNELLPETYQWRVRGENSAQNLSPYSTRNLLIDTNRNISTEIVELRVPANNESFTLTPSQSIRLSWNRILLATNYIIEFRSVTAGTAISLDPETAQNETLIPATSLFQFPDNQEPFDVTYTWRVRAENNESITEFSEEFSFTVLAPELTN